VTVHAGNSVVLGRNAPPDFGPGVLLDYEYTGFSLWTDEEVALIAPDGTIVDSVFYGEVSFPNVWGRAMSLAPGSFDHESNDNPENWCPATEACSDDDFGTPGGKNPPCSVATQCGNGVLNSGEECDDGNDEGNDECDAYCLVPLIPWICGDGVTDPSEECDDGNKLDDDCCTSQCLLTSCICCYNPNCGDGIVQVEWGEQCDDGNNSAGDGCNEWCRNEGIMCGNGEVEIGEQCDDGNTTAGDGCADDCDIEWQCTGEYWFGQLLITEAMFVPTTSPVDKWRWFEVVNMDEAAIDLGGWMIGNQIGDIYYLPVDQPVVVQPGQFVVFARDPETLVSAGIQADCKYSLPYVSSGLRLLAPDGTVVDSVFGPLGPSWSWDDKGHAHGVDPSAMDYQLNDLGQNWCPATTLMPNGDFGTPGEANPACP